nr:OmpA family protein [Dyella sp. ASV24]
MRINFSAIKAFSFVLASALALAACGNVSQNVHKDGLSADSMVWPKVTDTTPMHRGGTFPNRENLMRVRAGLNKHQISDLIGFPHFSEGIAGVREWNYVFNFIEPIENGDVVTCQFKVLFDENKLARSFYWLPESCARFQKPDPTPAAPVTTDRVTFSADALFLFDRTGLADITGNGRAQLDELAQKLKKYADQIQSIRIQGHADRLGSDAYNSVLSQKRADTVKAYLVSQGISSDLMTSQGRGSSKPVTECTDTNRSKLIACLAPNRRVEILITSTKGGTER